MQANHLINEKSPYLLQHAYNPVNWYGWREEAFLMAKKENKPIFLSIGYSTCHWCHVMEQESFEDEEVAELLNKYFLCIKVDREERPDVDSVYMTVCQALTGSGGWPLTIMMTPDQKPFFAGTYIPKTNRYGRMGMLELLYKIGEGWIKAQDTMVASGEEIMQLLEKSFVPQISEVPVSKSTIKQAVTTYKRIYDPIYGGFGSSPKFPTPHNLMFLLKYSVLEKDEEALSMVEHTLLNMYKGGLFDHIGYGFSRYSTEEKWLIPHFEKMLYDNALLTITYIEAYEVTKNPLYEGIARKTIDYVLRELKSYEGGFYSAEDADSDGEEGKFYVFNPLEIIQLLGEEEGTYFNDYFGIIPGGNFEGKSIPNKCHHATLEENSLVETLRKKVFDYRKERTTLHRDDKVLTSWNAMMIVALAKAYKALGDSAYYEEAQEGIAFIEEKMFSETGRLMARYRKGDIDYLAYLDDYAFLIWAYISLYEATFEMKYLEKALYLTKEVEKLFGSETGGYFLYGKDGEKLIARPVELYDGAIPSGNSVMANNLILLARMTGDKVLEEKAYTQLQVYSKSLKQSPIGHSFYMMALLFEMYPSRELVCVPKEEKDLEHLRCFLNKHYLGNILTVVKPIEHSPGYLEAYTLKNNATTYYLCQNHSCLPPTNDFLEIEKNLLLWDI